jgi:hypothetical protein
MQATLQEFPFSATGSINLVHKLKDAIMEVKIRNENEGALVLWMLFMGGISARRGEDRIWFVPQIEKLSGRLGLGDWEVVRGRCRDCGGLRRFTRSLVERCGTRRWC